MNREKETQKTIKTVYYSDEMKDDFAGTKISKAKVGSDFPYIRRSVLWNILAFLVYYVVAFPIVFLTAKIYLGLKFENRRALKKLSRTGYYLFGNHTQILDAFVPPVAAFPKRAYVVADADAVSIPFLRNIVLMLGAIPVPTDVSGLRIFSETLSARIAQKRCVAEYPERHIWPFYTGIRNFPDNAFHAPVRDGVPAIAMVATYRRRRGFFRWSNRPGMTVSFSEPFFPDPRVSQRDARTKLRDDIRDFMLSRSGSPDNVEYIRYVYRKNS